MKKKYRLRWNREIIGFAQETPEGILYKGKEWLWFLRGKPRYNQIDEYIGIKDKLHREIYELDIVSYSLSTKNMSSQAVVLWQEQSQQFVLYDFLQREVVPIFINEILLFENDPLEIISHLFTQPELEKQIPYKRE